MDITAQLKEITDRKGTPLLIEKTGTKLLVPRTDRTIRRWIASALNGGEVEPALEKAVLEIRAAQEATAN